MPSPSIVSISPNLGPTAGRLLVELVGDGFQPSSHLDEAGSTVVRPPSVQVLIRDRAAQDVRVLAEDRLTCVVPAGDLGRADVVVQNLDATGAPIPGEKSRACSARTSSRVPMIS